PAQAAGRPVTDCTTATGTTVVVDFSHWGGPLLRACGSTPTSGYTLLNQGGWHTSGTEHDGPAFVCRIGYAGFRHGTQYPTPAEEACVNTPPASAYWTYWVAGPGQDTWTYSQVGAVSYHPAAGSISLWVFGGTNISGNSGSAVPPVSPASLRAGGPRATASVQPGAPEVVNAPPADPDQPASHGSYAPALVTLLIAALLAGGAVAAQRRRHHREREIR
ncbi:MAG TPA: hypothetical protein VMR14_00460, partial [Streptosporangiaceae bacterium]|nr:hypothetical protein [Streptosporangiaceae bacterium]